VRRFFFEKKAGRRQTKKLFDSGLWALATPTPTAQRNKVFLLRAGRSGFSSEKEVLNF
jgi:hypothetical protein